MGPRGGIRVNSPDSYTVSQQKYHSKQIDSRQKKSRNIQEPTRCKTTGVQQPVSYIRQPAVTNNQSTSYQNRYKISYVIFQSQNLVLAKTCQQEPHTLASSQKNQSRMKMSPSDQ